MSEVSRRQFLAGGAASALSCSLVFADGQEANAFQYEPPAQIPFSPERVKANELIARAAKPAVVKVRDHVYAAIGYALANMIMIETPGGLVIIDTTESFTAARTIWEEFRKITDKPVKYVIYTHNHGDHFRGTKVLYQPGVEVIAHDEFMKEVKLQELRGKRGMIGAMAMFGLMFPYDDRYPMLGTWPEPGVVHLHWETIRPEDLIWPTKTFKDRYAFTLGGIDFNLLHVPGETPDQIIVEIPQYKTVCCADNFYPSFPNLYTIRGTSYRPVLDWAEAQNTVIRLAPDILVPSHGMPLHGLALIKEVLGNYREAILHVHRIAFEAAQEFKSIDEVASRAGLPPELAVLPYLQQFYGSIPYCVRSIYEGLVGWFDGDPVNLQPMTRKELGAEIIALAGSAENVLLRAQKAQQEGRHQATLELCEAVLANDERNQAARKMKIASLMALSRSSINMPTVNYYQSFAWMEQNKM
ncbi:MAG: alkyl/aryl-sulfatase [Deltaproteobacteria bacterium]|nr:alkyl/aryl-sulfatase [Deltaproteobacteria bacterium]